MVIFWRILFPPVTPHTVAVTEHGAPFAAVVQRGHVAGVQFHPEKSGDTGLTILRNFLAMCRGGR
jgi:glutamine amidotransferase